MLLALPNELLLAIYTNLDTLTSCSRLSRTNHKLHELWVANNNHIINAYLRRRITAFDGAVTLAIAETHQAGPEVSKSSICLRTIAPTVLDNAAKCERVTSLYKDVWLLKQTWHNEPWDVDFIARVYYDCLLLACAHDQPPLRRAARRTIKSLSLRERRHYIRFTFWLMNIMSDAEVSKWHNIHLPAVDVDDPGFHDYVEHWNTDRWYFAMSTLDLYARMPFTDGKGIGPDEHWSDIAETRYRVDWE